VKKVILTFFFIIFAVKSFSLERKDASNLKDLGYPWENFYIHNYGSSNTYWYTIEEHLDLNPKFLALVLQNVEEKDQKLTYKYTYNSRHNFFKMETISDENKSGFSLPNFFSKNTLKAEEISDKEIDINEFIEKVLDHCKYTQLRNLKDKKGVDVSVSNQKDCRISHVNQIEFKDLIFEQFEKNKDFKNFLVNKDNVNKFTVLKRSSVKDPKKEQVSTKENLKANQELKSLKENINLAINWSNYNSLIVANIKMDKSNSTGSIEVILPDGSGKCIGTIAINISTYLGTWSINCDDSEVRSWRFKKEMYASGKINRNDQNFLVGEGKDRLGNKVVFQSEKL
jgi:hypothetical protein